MQSLINAKCSACNSSSIALVATEIETLMNDLPTWQLVEEQTQVKDDKNKLVMVTVQKLQCTFYTKRYPRSLKLTNDVAALAELENHHPDIHLSYSEVTVSWWTHVVNGLHKNDFIMAAKTSELFNSL